MIKNMAFEMTSMVILNLMLITETLGVNITIQGSRHYAIQGQPFSFTCTFNPGGFAQSELYKNGARVQAVQFSNDGSNKCFNVTSVAALCDPSRCSCSQQGDTFTARWTLSSINDASSTWMCREINNQSPLLNLKVAVPVSSVKLEDVSGNQIDFVAGRVISLTCVTGEARPRSYIQWYIGYDNYTTSSISAVTNGQDEMTSVRSVLTFTPTKYQANLTVNCKAYNINPDTTVELMNKPLLNRLHGPETPVVIIPFLLSYVVNETNRLGPIECKSTCKPTCTYKWVTPEQTYVSGSILSISNIQRSQAGVYKCIASNNIGNRTSEDVIVTVQYAARLSGMTISNGNFTVAEHSTATITCIAEGLPRPYIKLIHFPSGKTIHYMKDGVILQYHFSSVKCEDTGEYRCEAKNNFPPISSLQRTLQILCAPRFKLRPTNELYGLIDADLNISATVDAYPKPVITCYFSKRNEESRKYSNNEIVVTSDGVWYSIYIYKSGIKSADYGEYTIMAINDIGMGQHVIDFRMAGKPSKPMNVEIIICKETIVILQWQGGYNGGSNQTFFIEYFSENDPESKFIQEVNDTKGKQEYYVAILSDLIPSSQYVFELYASNKHGSSNSDVLKCTTMYLDENGNKQTIFEVGVSLTTIGCILVIASVLIVILFIWRKSRKDKTETEKENTYSELNENREQPNVYEMCREDETENVTNEGAIGEYEDPTPIP